MECPNCKLLNPAGTQRCDCGFDFASGRVERSYLSADDPLALNGLQGWLAWVGFRLIVEQLGLLYALLYALFSLFVPGTHIIATNFILETVYLVGLVYLSTLFFQKKKAFPRYYIIFLIVASVAALVVVVMKHPTGERTFWEPILSAIILVPYFLESRRVKVTFVQ